MTEEMFRLAPSLSRALAGETVRVGTRNPAKLGAVQVALQSFTREGATVSLVPVDVESGVAAQPMGWDEIVCGARNRALAAFESGDCVLAVGIEDGLVRLTDGKESASGRSETDAFYNVGGGTKTSIKSLCQQILTLSGSDLAIQYEPAGQTFVTNRVGCPKKAAQELGFEAEVSLSDGLQRLIEWRAGDLQQSSRRAA